MANWTRQEDEIIIADYFDMLNTELRGEAYNKAAHRKALLKMLPARSKGAIEFKHCNISAVLIKYGMPYVKGYQPRFNYQNLLEEEVLDVFKQQKGIVKVFNEFVTEKVDETKRVNFNKWNVESPRKSEKEKIKKLLTFKPVKKNYLEIEQRNQSIGNLGEQIVFNYEIWRLEKAEYPKLAKEVRWISKDLGDGAGYDILSKDLRGRDIYIEVKTTKLGKDTPIFFSNLENEFSKVKTDKFFLYRVFDVKDDPKLFIKKGQLDNICSQVEPTNFKGYF